MKRVVLVGMPNTGKSTFFNRVTGASARVGNWPGITVDLLAARLPLGGAMVELVDLPGVYDLEMVMKISVQEQVRMTPQDAKASSPLVNPPRVKCPLVVAVGGAGMADDGVPPNPPCVVVLLLYG